MGIMVSHSNLSDFKNDNFATTNNNQMQFIIDKTIPICSSTKVLGLTIDCTPSWPSHIDTLTKKKTKHYVLFD
jgi:hypothetical protein